MDTLRSFLVWLLNLKSCFVQSIPSVIQRCNQDDVEKGSFIMQIIREVSLKTYPYHTESSLTFLVVKKMFLLSEDEIS